MHIRLLLVAAVAAVGLTVTATATAKGPSEAKIEGPGLSSPLLFKGSGEGPGTLLGDFTQQAGFFPAMYGQSPNPMLRAKPKRLGPRYRVTYTVPGPDNMADAVRQDLYPYARGGAVTYMKPGQTFFGREHTFGGWYRSTPALKRLLVQAGLPARAPALKSASGFPAMEVSIAGAAFAALVVVGAIFGRSSIARWLPNRSTFDSKGPNV